RMSPDGRWLTYLKDAPEIQSNQRLTSRPDLWLLDLRTGVSFRVARRFEMSGFDLAPLEWMASNLTWSPDSKAFFFVDPTLENVPEIRRFQVDSKQDGSELIVQGQATGEEFRDLALSGDGQKLSYLEASNNDGDQFELRVLELASGVDRKLLEMRRA